MILDFLKTLFGANEVKTSGEDAAVVAAAVENVIRGTDPRLRMVSGYTKKLRAPVERSLAYSREVVQRLPGPFQIDSKTFGSYPQIRAFFSSIEYLKEIFGKDRTLQEFLDSPQHAWITDCYVLLVADKTQRNVLGMEMDGEMLRKDVAQTVVSFDGHRFVAPAASVDGLRQELVERAFDHLVGCALRRLVTLKAQTEEFRERSLLLQMKLQQRLAKKRGLETVAPGALLEGTQTLEIRRQLQNAEQQLLETSASLGTLNDYLSQIQDVLSHPEDHLQIRNITTRLDRMGIMRKPDSPQPANDISYAEIEIGEERNAVGIMIRYSPQELPSNLRPQLSI